MGGGLGICSEAGKCIPVDIKSCVAVSTCVARASVSVIDAEPPNHETFGIDVESPNPETFGIDVESPNHETFGFLTCGVWSLGFGV